MDARAVVFTAPKQAEVQSLNAAEPGPGQALVAANLTLMSMGTEIICYKGESDPGTHWHGWVRYPFHPGYSSVGRIVQLGEGAEGFAIGDRVFHTMGHRGLYTTRVDSGTFLRIPDAVSNEDAAWAKLATIAQTGVRQTEHHMGDTAVVIGLGPIGQLSVQYLRVLGLKEILAIDMNETRLKAAMAHGATAAFHGRSGDAESFVREHTGGELADAVYDVTGFPDVFPTALKLARRFGTVVLQGDCPHPSRQHLTHDVLTRQLRVFGSHNENLPPKHARWSFRRQAELFYTYAARGQMRLRDLITRRFSPDEAQEAYSSLTQERGGTVGAAFEWRAD